MSRNKRRGGNSSPIKHYLQFSGGTGVFSYYNKGTKTRTELDKLEVIILDVRASITGFDSTSKAQITSNLVTDTNSEKFKVVSWKDKKTTDIAEGLYKDIKEKVTSKSVGGRFTTNVLCLCDLGNGQEVCNLQLSGSALNGWINFLKGLEKGSEYDSVITFKRGALSVVDGKEFRAVSKEEEEDLDKKIAKNKRHPRPIWFYVLDFETADLTDEQVDLASEQDDILQEYFEGVSPKISEDDSEEDDSTNPTEEQEGKDDEEKPKLPF